MPPSETHPLLRLWSDPRSAGLFKPSDWNRALRAARGERLTARLGYRLEDAGVLDACPVPVIDMLLGARAYPAFVQGQARHELHHLLRALAPLQVELILLKGAAYLSAGMTLSRGRPLKDVDLLVHRGDIGPVEAQLVDYGWESQSQNDYDQRYYRQWMHEIPPLRHPERALEVDVHHSLLPTTSRLRLDPEGLWGSSVPIPDMPGARTLGPYDMLLHTSTHLFYDGEIHGGLGDLWDIDALLRQFADTRGFWDGLLERAGQIELGRPLHYALVFAARLLGTPVPPGVLARAAERFGPAGSVDRLMGTLVATVLDPDPGFGTPLARWLLYVRSHWLRMPPRLLIPHLARKATRRLGVVKPSEPVQTVLGSPDGQGISGRSDGS